MVPIIAIVLILSFTIAPVPPGILMAFIIGAILLVVGMMFFTLGAEMSMTPMGERIGTRIAQSKRLPVIIGLCFILGFIITISEPDLQVLAGQVPSVSNMTLILAVAVPAVFTRIFLRLLPSFWNLTWLVTLTGLYLFLLSAVAHSGKGRNRDKYYKNIMKNSDIDIIKKLFTFLIVHGLY